MTPLEIIVIVACVLFVVSVVTATIVKKTRDRKKGITPCCGCCSSCSDCCHCRQKEMPEDVKAVLAKINSTQSK